MNTDEFIRLATEKYGNRYDYSQAEYTKCDSKVIIICPKHGPFKQVPYTHLVVEHGCPKCGIEALKVSKEEFINRSTERHKGKYDYSQIRYRTANDNVDILCPIHGLFKQKARNHMASRIGCPKCAKDNSGFSKVNTYRHTKAKLQFITRCKKMHGDKYDYSDTLYINARCKVTIRCKEHGLFLQDPKAHLAGSGCPQCNISCNESKAERRFLDYLHIPNESRHIRLQLKDNTYVVDGMVDNVVYEFLGDYWHGNPERFKSSDINKKNKITFGVLYNDTINKLNQLCLNGYRVNYIWERDWKRFERGIDRIPKIRTEKDPPVGTPTL